MALWRDSTFNTQVEAPTFKATGATGLLAGRFVGVTVSGSPTSGTFEVGDYILTRNGNIWTCTASGSPGTWLTPTDLRDQLESGEETMARDAIASSAVSTSTQVLRLTYFTARKSETTTQVRVLSGSTAAAATPSLCRVGLYGVAANGDATLVAAIANDTTLFASTNTAYTRSWTTPYAKTAGQRLAMGVLVVTSVSAPVLAGLILNAPAAAEGILAPRLAGLITSQTDLPSSFLGSAVASNTNRHYGAILP